MFFALNVYAISLLSIVNSLTLHLEEAVNTLYKKYKAKDLIVAF